MDFLRCSPFHTAKKIRENNTYTFKVDILKDYLLFYLFESTHFVVDDRFGKRDCVYLSQIL